MAGLQGVEGAGHEMRLGGAHDPRPVLLGQPQGMSWPLPATFMHDSVELMNWV